MSKVIRAVGKVAGVVAVVASVVGGPVAAVAKAATAIAMLAGQVAGPKKPRATGSVSTLTIGANLPTPYAMGRTFLPGSLVHRAAWGGTVDGVPNPYMANTQVLTLGPIDGIESVLADFAPLTLDGSGAASGHYAGFLWVKTQLGALPESAALAANFSGEPNWGSGYKLSGVAALKATLKFDKKGKVYSSGEPSIGVVARGVKVYDPRLDSTYPGGSGAHRVNDEATWGYSTNPALHAATYAIGRFRNGILAIGGGLPADSIDWPMVVEWANLCGANDWTISGTVFEPGDKWANLKAIAEAGGAEPVFAGGLLSFKLNAPRVAIDTISVDDLAGAVPPLAACKPYAERFNSVIARYRSEAHKWEFVQTDAYEVAGFITADGERKSEEVQLDLVADKDQAAQLAAYRLHNSRETEPFSLVLKPRFYEYRPGQCLTVNLPEFAAPFDAMIIGRTPDPASMTVTLELESETASKHALALAATGTAPPAATLVTGIDRDLIAQVTDLPFGYGTLAIRNASLGGDPDLTGVDVGATAKITIASHAWDYPTSGTSATYDAGEVTGLAFSTLYHVYFDSSTLTGGAVTYAASTDYAVAINSVTNPNRHYVGSITTPADGAANTTGDPWVGWSGNWYF